MRYAQSLLLSILLLLFSIKAASSQRSDALRKRAGRGSSMRRRLGFKGSYDRLSAASSPGKSPGPSRESSPQRAGHSAQVTTSTSHRSMASDLTLALHKIDLNGAGSQGSQAGASSSRSKENRNPNSQNKSPARLSSPSRIGPSPRRLPLGMMQPAMIPGMERPPSPARIPEHRTPQVPAHRKYVAVASIKADVAGGQPFSAFSKTPVAKVMYDKAPGGRLQTQTVDHVAKASAGGISSGNSVLQATAQGHRTTVKMHLFDKGTGYIQHFYDRKPQERKDYDSTTSPGKVTLPVDKTGNRMGVVAQINGPGYLKVKGDNRE